MRHLRLVVSVALAGLVIMAGLMSPANAKTTHHKTVTNSSKLLKVAASLKGRPYVYGATGPRAFDCSGYTKYVYKKALGLTIGRTTRDQIHYRRINKFKKRGGDIILYMSHGRPYHAAIYAGKKKMWDASRPGHPVAKRALFSHNYVVVRPY